MDDTSPLLNPPLHRLYRHYSEMPYSLRTMYTAALLVLGLGYLFGLIYVFTTYAGRAGGNPMIMSYRDLRGRLCRKRAALAARNRPARTDVEHAAPR